MALQLATLAVFAARVPLSAQFPASVENSAAAGVAIVQIFGAILLAPVLAATMRSAILSMAGGAPILLAATLLAGSPAVDALVPICLLTTWLLALIGNGQIHLLRAALSVLGIAGPVAWYAFRESGQNADLIWPSLMVPTLGTASISLHVGPWWSPFVLPLALIVTNITPFWVKMRRRTTRIETAA